MERETAHMRLRCCCRCCCCCVGLLRTAVPGCWRDACLAGYTHAGHLLRHAMRRRANPCLASHWRPCLQAGRRHGVPHRGGQRRPDGARHAAKGHHPQVRQMRAHTGRGGLISQRWGLAGACRAPDVMAACCLHAAPPWPVAPCCSPCRWLAFTPCHEHSVCTLPCPCAASVHDDTSTHFLLPLARRTYKGYEEVQVPAVRPAAPPPGEQLVKVGSRGANMHGCRLLLCALHPGATPQRALQATCSTATALHYPSPVRRLSPCPSGPSWRLAATKLSTASRWGLVFMLLLNCLHVPGGCEWRAPGCLEACAVPPPAVQLTPHLPYHWFCNAVSHLPDGLHLQRKHAGVRAHRQAALWACHRLHRTATRHACPSVHAVGARLSKLL